MGKKFLKTAIHKRKVAFYKSYFIFKILLEVWQLYFLKKFFKIFRFVV